MKVRDPVDIDNVFRPRQPDLHHGNQTLSAAQDLCALTMLLQQSNGFRDGLRAEILERLGDHFFASSSKQQINSTPASKQSRERWTKPVASLFGCLAGRLARQMLERAPLLV